MLYLLSKYWRKHKKSAAALMFSGFLMTAVIFVTFLQLRATFNRALHSSYDQCGKADAVLPEVSDELIDGLLADAPEATRAHLYNIGKFTVGENSFTYGFAEDKTELLHIPFESGGLPKSEGEIAVCRKALNIIGWAGKLGDSVTFGGVKYTVVGIIGEAYSERGNSELYEYYGGDLATLPSVYVPRPAEIPDGAYRITLLDGIFTGDKESDRIKSEKIIDAVHCETGLLCLTFNKFENADEVPRIISFQNDVRWIFILAGTAALIAVLSVFSVLRSVFIERENHIRLLRRTGVSKKRLRLMYAVECTAVVIIQTAFGLLFGLGGYSLMNYYQTNALGMSEYSGFTNDRFVTERTTSPFAAAVVLSAAVTVGAYLLAGVFSSSKPREKTSRAKAGSFGANFRDIFRCRSVTVIQTVSLTLICFGTLLGYMYFTDLGKGDTPYIKEYNSQISCTVTEMNINMEENGIAEYYECRRPFVSAISAEDNSFGALCLADEDYDLGVNDENIAEYDSVTAAGKLTSTYAVAKTEDGRWGLARTMPSPEAVKNIRKMSEDEYKDLFTSGYGAENYLYRINTLLANAETIEALSDCVVSGRIDAEALNSGREIILVSQGATDEFSAGENVELASLCGREYFAISDVKTAVVKIGAVVNASKCADNAILSYAMNDGSIFNFLTTASGAETLGFHNAVYTEIIAAEPIDGGALPPNAEMKRTSLAELKHTEFVQNAFKYGGIFLISILMSLLGFSAYFMGIGLKLRTKDYEISTLRALGTSLAKIRGKVFAANLLLPIFAALTAGAGVFAVQRVTERGYGKLVVIGEELSAGLPPGMYFIPETEEGLKLMNDYFLERQLWKVPVIAPLITVFLIICAVTVILSAIALNRHKKSISSIMNAERRRQ